MEPPPLRRILYVEDEADIQAIVKLALERIGGFILKICSSGAEAIKEIPAFAPNLILLDVMMPDMDGPTTLKELRKIAQIADIPVIFMTAKVQPKEIAYYKELGALDVITKPFKPMALSETINNIWKRYHLT